MRGLTYAIAAIAAVGIMIAIGSRPAEEAPASAATAVSTAAMAESGTLTLKVPEMMCPFSCYPRVKESLENTAAVNGVELAAQKVEGVIDNRQVIVSYDAGFNLADAIDALQKEGFTESEMVQ
ncbi:hypothetical protein Poly51_15820 [Rubripirellula tenax]|uniref:Heavy-metal-associated domain protein n=1 Tax=Rubripirellula tenax TaxID=2528015 RepID=A0A5C6FDI5_9BACT|nr:heavy-metal-associated domain-containing protein [Rubripirellula tenax]TWU58802.1 hypothetical protein Poly51_15820 [Rubripirellula tenax]